MRISFFILDITTGGGIERATAILSNVFAQKGHAVTIISAFRQNATPIFDLNRNISIVYFLNESYTHKRPIIYILIQYIKVIRALKSYYKKHPQDIIIGQAFLACFFLWITGNNHNAYIGEHYKYDVYKKFIRIFRNYIYRTFRGIVALTSNDAERYHSHGLKATVIPNIAAFSTEHSCNHNVKRMISVGHLHPSKGYDLLLPALKPVFKKHPDWHIDIYGEGDDRQMLEKLRNDLGLNGHVNFPGFAYNIQKEYCNSAFYVMSSRYEGLPMVLLEAMSCGLPIVSFNCKEGPSTLLRNNAGYLVPPENIPAMSTAICQMIENEQLRKSYAKKALEVIKDYSPETIYKKWINLFESNDN